MKLLVIIPAYNEAQNLSYVVDDIKKYCPEFDYVIVNDGSKDNTVEVCNKNNYNLLNLPINLGLAGGVQAGIKYAHENGYDYAIQFDGDGQHQAKYIRILLENMEMQNADIVIGSRFVNQKKPHSLRMIGSNFIQSIIKVTTGKIIQDPTSGMRLLNRRIMCKFANSMNYGPEPDTISYLIRCGAKVIEVKVEMLERRAGESYLNLKRSIQYMIRMSMSIILIQFFRKKEKL